MWKFIFLAFATHFISTEVACMKIDKLQNSQGGEPDEFNDKFAIVVDAGSTGSRMFVYTWNPAKDGFANYSNIQLFIDKQGNPLVRKITPGISSFFEKPSNVRSYISNLLNDAAAEIPLANHQKTSLYILATAGMRLLTYSTQLKIWDEVRDAVRSMYKFKFENENAKTITGEEEALFGWIAVNCMLDSFPITNEEKKPTHGTLDMGGASMQIAFELSPDQPAPEIAVTNFDLQLSSLGNGVTYRIYAPSYLNYGVREFRHLYEMDLIKEYITSVPNTQLDGSTEINDPCLNREVNYTSSVNMASSTNFTELESNVTVQFTGQGDYDSCFKRITPLLKIGNNCDPLVCGIDGTKQPRINFTHMEFYGLSEFFYALQDVLPNESRSYDYYTIMPKIKNICALPWHAYLEQLRKEYEGKTDIPFEKLVNLKSYVCFKAVYVLAALHVGFSFPKDYKKLHPVTQLAGTEVQWALGALVYILNSEKQIAFKRRIITVLVVILALIAFSLCGLGIYLFYRQRKQRSSAATVESISMDTNQANNQKSGGVTVTAANSYQGSPNA